MRIACCGLAQTDPALVEAALNNPQRFAQMMQALMAESQRNRALVCVQARVLW